MCDNIIFMKAGIFFNIFMLFVWVGAAYCAPGDSKLVYHDFPKTMKDVSFIDMLELNTKGYEPWFDKKVYTGITLEKKTSVAADAAGADEGLDYCMESVSCNHGVDLEGVPIKQAVVVGINTGVVCEPNLSKTVLESPVTCVYYCVLDETHKKISDELCFYANAKGKVMPSNDPTAFNLMAEGYSIVFSGVTKEVEDEKDVECGAKLGKIADKENFFYCVVSNGS